MARYEASPMGRGRPRRFYPSTGRGTPPPNGPGGYYIGAHEYIGQTCDLGRRTREHVQNGDVPPGGYIDYMSTRPDSSREQRLAWEARKIRQKHPPRNQRGL